VKRRLRLADATGPKYLNLEQFAPLQSGCKTWHQVAQIPAEIMTGTLPRHAADVSPLACIVPGHCALAPTAHKSMCSHGNAAGCGDGRGDSVYGVANQPILDRYRRKSSVNFDSVRITMCTKQTLFEAILVRILR